MTSTTGLDLDGLRQLATAVAYRMLGSRTEAEDVAQEAMLRVHSAADREHLRSPEAFVTTVTTRLAIDHLRSARVRREEYLGPWLPEPVTTDPSVDGAAMAELSESISIAFLTVLESLGPVERAAFLLHDVFGMGYDELAAVLHRNPASCRQLVARARRRVTAGSLRRVVEESEHRRLLRGFVDAARTGDIGSLADLLTEDAFLLSDGGPRVKAARHPIVGKRRLVTFLGAIGPRVLGGRSVQVVPLNGEPGFVALDAGQVTLAGAVEVERGRIAAVRWVLNPDKLRWVHVPDDGSNPSAGSGPGMSAGSN